MCNAKLIISEALPSEFYYAFPNVDDLIKDFNVYLLCIGYIISGTRGSEMNMT